MSDTGKLQPGDTVRVTFETTVSQTGMYSGKGRVEDGDATVELIERADGSDSAEPQSAATGLDREAVLQQLEARWRGGYGEEPGIGWVLDELEAQDVLSFAAVQPVDDPSKDPVGTVRRGNTIRPSAWVKVDPDSWLHMGDGVDFRPDATYTNQNMPHREVIGVVPGTPAAEAELERARNGAGSAAGIYNWDEIYERKAPLSSEGTEARARHLLHLYDTLTLELSYKWGEEEKERFLRDVEERHPYRARQAADELSRQQGDEEPRGFKRGDVVRNKRTGTVLRVLVESLFGPEYYEAVPLWTGDGSEEPPAHVMKVRDRHGCVAERRPRGWKWTEGSAVGFRVQWYRHFGPVTEVRP